MRGTPISERSHIKWAPEVYGRSLLGCPLEVWYPAYSAELLIFAAIHGDEPETTILLSRAMRSLTEVSPSCAVVLAANPDGLMRGSRANARGVDLNRNFPSKNWSPEPTPAEWTAGDTKALLNSPGQAPASEPETKALIELIERIKPKQVLALHGPLACVDDPDASPLGRWMAEKSGMPMVPDVGYPTPGSFGSWCKERRLPVITYELPRDSFWNMMETHYAIFLEILRRQGLVRG